MTTTAPRIYVACLASYNAGRLHGAWIDAAQDADAIHEEIAAMLKASPVAGAEEYAIHDYEGFDGLRLAEYESIETVAALAVLLDDHGPALAAFYRNDPSVPIDELGDLFEEAYQGEHVSVEDFAEQLADDLGLIRDEAQQWPYSCVDWERAARDLFIGGDYWSADVEGGGVYVFRSC